LIPLTEQVHMEKWKYSLLDLIDFIKKNPDLRKSNSFADEVMLIISHMTKAVFSVHRLNGFHKCVLSDLAGTCSVPGSVGLTLPELFLTVMFNPPISFSPTRKSQFVRPIFFTQQYT
jgi:hypothetical protein